MFSVKAAWPSGDGISQTARTAQALLLPQNSAVSTSYACTVILHITRKLKAVKMCARKHTYKLTSVKCKLNTKIYLKEFGVDSNLYYSSYCMNTTTARVKTTTTTNYQRCSSHKRIFSPLVSLLFPLILVIYLFFTLYLFFTQVCICLH